MASLNAITHAIDADRELQRKLGEHDGMFLMGALVIESARHAQRDGVPFETWLSHVEALLEEYRT